MKNLFFYLMTLTLLSFQANAAEIYSANLTAFSLSAQMQAEIGLQNVNSGAVIVNVDDRLITLKLASQYKCQSLACPRSVLAPFSITLPLTNVEVDSCEVPHFFANQNQRQIEVQMTSVSKCMYAFGGPSFRMPPPTTVKYSIQGQTSALFEGDALQLSL